MTQVYVGTAADARELQRALVQLDIDALAAPASVFGKTAVLVPQEQAEEAKALIRALDDIVVLAAHRRGRDVVQFHGFKGVGGVA